MALSSARPDPPAGKHRHQDTSNTSAHCAPLDSDGPSGGNVGLATGVAPDPASSETGDLINTFGVVTAVRCLCLATCVAYVLEQHTSKCALRS
jgi:hypothetical protein